MIGAQQPAAVAPPAHGPRREDKYLVADEIAARLTAWAAARWRPDPHAGSDGVYQVASLYFDTAALDGFRRGGVRAWPKHRVRGYGPAPVAQFLEEKVRRGDAVWKRRVPCAASDWAGGAPAASSPGLAWFRARWQSLGLQPVLLVHYQRTAFAGPDGERLTIDTAITCRMATAASGLDLAAVLPPSLARAAFAQQVLELKYVGRPSPALLEARGLVAVASVRCSKYAGAVRALGLAPAAEGSA